MKKNMSLQAADSILRILTGIRDLFPARIVLFMSILLSSRATLLCKPVAPVTIVVSCSREFSISAKYPIRHLSITRVAFCA